MVTESNEYLAWAAGFFDGEGHVRADIRSSGSIRPALRIAQVDPEVLHKFQEALGVGKVMGPYGPYKNDPIKKQPFFRYQTQSLPEIKQIAEALWPWLSTIKKQQFSEVLRRCEDHGKR